MPPFSSITTSLSCSKFSCWLYRVLRFHCCLACAHRFPLASGALFYSSTTPFQHCIRDHIQKPISGRDHRLRLLCSIISCWSDAHFMRAEKEKAGGIGSVHLSLVGRGHSRSNGRNTLAFTPVLCVPRLYIAYVPKSILHEGDGKGELVSCHSLSRGLCTLSGAVGNFTGHLPKTDSVVALRIASRQTASSTGFRSDTQTVPSRLPYCTPVSNKTRSLSQQERKIGLCGPPLAPRQSYSRISQGVRNG